MSGQPLVRVIRAAGSVALAACLLSLSSCGFFQGEGDVPRPATVSAFDEHPCALFTSTEMAGVVGDTFLHLAGDQAEIKGDPSAQTGGGDTSCTYLLQRKGGGKSVTPQVQQVQLTLGHARSDGTAAMNACVAAAGTGAGVYQVLPIGDRACVTAQYDVWIKIGGNVYHVGGNPQPGWPNVADGHDQVIPLVLAVARAAADRFPKS